MPRPTLLIVTGLPGSGKSCVAGAVATDLNASVLGHDWVMAALRAQLEVWNAMKALDQPAFRNVGWSVMLNIARAQLRASRSVILDGVARTPQIHAAREVGDESDARTVVALCVIDDAELHRQRIAGRERRIPGWPELSWDDVQRSRADWQPPEDVDVVLDSSHSLEANFAASRSVLGFSGTGAP